MVYPRTRSCSYPLNHITADHGSLPSGNNGRIRRSYCGSLEQVFPLLVSKSGYLPELSVCVGVSVCVLMWIVRKDV